MERDVFWSSFTYYAQILGLSPEVSSGRDVLSAIVLVDGSRAEDFSPAALGVGKSVISGVDARHIVWGFINLAE